MVNESVGVCSIWRERIRQLWGLRRYPKARFFITGYVCLIRLRERGVKGDEYISRIYKKGRGYEKEAG